MPAKALLIRDELVTKSALTVLEVAAD